MPRGVYERAVTPLAVRFWRYVDKNGPIVRPELGPCWTWTGAINHGYGAIGRGRRGEPTLIASRVSWELNRGPVPDGVDVCHKCDNPPCTNPLIFFWGRKTTTLMTWSTRGETAKGMCSRGPYRGASTGRVAR